MFPIWGMMWGVPQRMMKALEINEPVELFYVMRSICDFGKTWKDQTNTTNLAKNSREKIFYDTYPLNENVSRETFEIDILNHFLYRRIGFETVTGFKIALITKLREIMPKYNVMFDIMFKDILSDIYEEEFSSRKDNEGGFVNQNNGGYQNELTRNETNEETEHTISSAIEDLRKSDTPQNRLAEVRSGEYVSEYDYNQRDLTDDKNRESSNTTGENGTNTHNDTDTNHHVDTDTFIHNKRSVNTTNLVDKYGLLSEYNSIMGMIYNDLDCLFLQVFDY